MKGSKRKKMILSNDVMELHSAYSRLEVDVFKVSKLQLRSITPDSFTQHVVNNIYLLLPIFLSLMSMAIALITTIQDTNISDTMESDLNAIILLTFALGCMSTAYLLHAMLEAKKKEILQKHLVVVAEIENERSEK
jgi:succinate dehydrogenase hydrophobic anchor subunit